MASIRSVVSFFAFLALLVSATPAHAQSICPPNFYGPNCTFCVASTTCNSHGTCDVFTGSCLCFQSFGGASCNQCAPGRINYPLCIVDSVPPVLSLPASITVDATSPAGATVNYTVTATDNSGVAPTVSCIPQSGVTFTIGTTAVNCTATDGGGISATGSFTVTVNGAVTQLENLIASVGAYTSPWGTTNSLDAKLQLAIKALEAIKGNSVGVACNALNAFVNEVQAQSGNNVTEAGAIQLIGSANRIGAVLACP